VTRSHSRPHCSNDNPYSESQFRTMKYRPEFPDRFGSFQDAHAFCGRFFRWYNDEHRPGPRQSRSLHQMPEHACRWKLAPGLGQRGRVAPGHDAGSSDK
jgi:transposase InsO family protein